MDFRTWSFVTDCHHLADPSSFPYEPFHWDRLEAKVVGVILLDKLKGKLENESVEKSVINLVITPIAVVKDGRVDAPQCGQRF